MVEMVVCAGGFVDVVCVEVTGCEDGCVFGGVDSWVSEFWRSGLVYMLLLSMSMSTAYLT